MSYGLRGKKTEEPKKMNLRWWFTDACHAIVLHYHKQLSSFSRHRFHFHGYSFNSVQAGFLFAQKSELFLSLTCLLSSALKLKPGGHDVLTNRIPNQKLVYSKKITSTLSFTR